MIPLQGLAYPLTAQYAGWILTGFALVQIPLWLVHSLCTEEGSCLAKLFRPNKAWGPSRHNDKVAWLQQQQEKTTAF